jgi:hypothetical protein
MALRNLSALVWSRAHTAALKNVIVGDAVQDFESHHLRAMVRLEQAADRVALEQFHNSLPVPRSFQCHRNLQAQ